MEPKNIKITSRSQFERLVELMEEHQDIGRGKLPFGANKNVVRTKWEEFAVELNSLGPPSRTATEWQRVWIHYKAKIKKKVANNRKNVLATGGGKSKEISLSPLEESVVQLVQMTRQIVPIGEAFGLENVEPSPSPQLRTAPSPPITAPSPSTTAPSTAVEAANVEPPTSRRRNTRLAPEQERLELLKKQVRTQRELLKTMNKVEKTAYKNYQINKQLLELERRKADEKSELHNLKKECQRLKIAKLQMEIGSP